MPLSSVLGAQSLVKPGVCTSSTRPASSFEGQVIYETDTDLVQVYNGSGWRALGRMVASTNGSVLQVVSTTKTDTFSTTSTTFTDVTGLTATISPSVTSSKILIMAHVTISVLNTTNLQSSYIRLNGGNSSTYVGDASGNRVQASGGIFQWSGELQNYGGQGGVTLIHLDNPATTSSTTYAVQMRVGASTTGYVNRSGWDDNTSGYGRFSSSITLMEIAG